MWARVTATPYYSDDIIGAMGFGVWAYMAFSSSVASFTSASWFVFAMSNVTALALCGTVNNFNSEFRLDE
jgi:hypothetical protein